MIINLDFKSKHSTDMCIFTVKSLVKYYTCKNTPVYTCLLDASKAFDRGNHWMLFAKFLINCNKFVLNWVNIVRTISPFATVYVRVEFCPLNYLPYM